MSLSLTRRRTPPTGAVPVTALLIGTIALQSAVPPFATDMYTPAFPHVTAGLDTTAALVGLTLTAFFLGFAAGQLAGGPWSDQHGRRMPLIVGGVVCMSVRSAAPWRPRSAFWSWLGSSKGSGAVSLRPWRGRWSSTWPGVTFWPG
ncbi:Major Facilitator Superfamily protein [Raineyella antarctica]|uniref:Major Facilitator Superfamily protein n=1 Tax=Raineyella antarctica TaxID=1577474 RepID=A0A1G6HL87_9ACTN|nr:MFS transporter [Raineyella antarctica]SDB95020.1 Major Facilitator Superfamily protein [Raineyella antarctica]